ncbi:MAG: hypothetical protein LBG05_10625 [Treponema sp.]|nr:hypothetical protein [Treponema sp.]
MKRENGRQKILWRMLALALVFGLVLAGCNGEEDPGYSTYHKTINVAMINATYPVLSFALSIFEINEDPTFVAIERKNTFDYTKLPENVYLLPGATKSGNTNFFDIDKPAYINFVTGQYLADKETKFNLYLCDRLMGLILYGMVANGIPETNYTVTMYLDGAVYQPANRYSADSDPQSLYDKDCADVRTAFEKAAVGDTSWTDLFYHPDSRFELDLYYPLAVLNRLDNIVWNIHNIEAFKDAMPEVLRDEVQAFIDTGKIQEKTIVQQVNAVKDSGKMTELEYMLKLRWGEAESESVVAQFDKDNAKKTLLVLGTYTNLEQTTTQSQAGAVLIPDLLEQVKNRYEAEYNLFYKGHPQTPTDSPKLNSLNTMGFTDLPTTIPAETMMLFYDNVYVGGYPGSTFVSSAAGQTVFSFGPKSVLEAVAGIEMENFADTEYIYYDSSSWHIRKE